MFWQENSVEIMFWRENSFEIIFWQENSVKIMFWLEFVTGGVELLKAVLHGYAGGLIFMK